MKRSLLALVPLLAAPLASAQTISLGPVPCAPAGENVPVTARVDPPPPGDTEVRLYFRRLSLEVEDFYYVEMEASGGGNYWAVLPQPEETALERKELESARSSPQAWARWWREKEASEDRDPNGDLDRETIRERAAIGRGQPRDWMKQVDDPTLQRFLERAQYEPAELYVAVVDATGRELLRSPQSAIEVRSDCRAALTPQQAGFAMNLTIGETAAWQAGRPVFHWECTGIVTRVDPLDVLRADDACRACVVAWWPRAATIAAAAGAVGIVAVSDDDDPGGGEISPSRP